MKRKTTYAGFKLFSFLSDITKGNTFFVKHKMYFGALLVGVLPIYSCGQRAPSKIGNDVKLADQDEDDYCELYDYYNGKVSDTAVYRIANKMPEFDNLFGYFGNAINTANFNGYGCSINISFIVEKDGSLSNIRILGSSNPTFDKEAIRILKTMPKWKPGTCKKKPVRVYYEHEYSFSLGIHREHSWASGGDYAPESRKRMEEISCYLVAADPYEVELAQLGPIYDGVEEMPSFPGGEEKMQAYIKQNLPKVKKEKAEEPVLMSCIVEKDGTISNIRPADYLWGIFRGSVKEVEEARVIRLIESMPKWKPGQHDGEPVRVRIMIPVEFD